MKLDDASRISAQKIAAIKEDNNSKSLKQRPSRLLQQPLGFLPQRYTLNRVR